MTQCALYKIGSSHPKKERLHRDSSAITASATTAASLSAPPLHLPPDGLVMNDRRVQLDVAVSSPLQKLPRRRRRQPPRDDSRPQRVCEQIPQIQLRDLDLTAKPHSNEM
jgi:hypothetical protein